MLRESQIAEARARHQTQRLHAVFQQLNHPAGFLDETGHILDLNDAGTELIGQSVEEVRGNYIASIPALGGEAVFNPQLRRAALGETVKFQQEVHTSDQNSHMIAMSLKPVPGDDGKVVLLIWEGHDITERVRAEEALQETFHQFQQSQKMEAIGRLAGGIAHDFNNLLTSILGFSNMALEQLSPEDEVIEDLGEVIQAATRAQNLTQKLLALSRKDVPDSQPVDLNKLLREMDHLIRVSLTDNVELVANLSEDPCMILADPTSMEQVILNLAVNARDSMPKGGRFYLSTGLEEVRAGMIGIIPELSQGMYNYLSVRDTGCGMSDDILEHVFEPFFTTKESGQGTGLGLSTVYAIVKQYSGGIELKSEPGVGTEFRIYFPYYSHVEQMMLDLPEELKATPLPTGTETVLMVEDEDGVRRMGVRMIESLGYKILLAKDGEEGVRVAEEYEGTIDLIVTDVVMPNLSGPEMIDRLRLSKGHIPHLYVSGFTMDKLKEHGADDSEQNLLRKPYNRETLARRMRQILDGQV
ncbi:MAG: response regulator [Verrucomicrobia bacterium]|nr:response regulator [Verrucomicrobiota bacterium]MCH8511010.1 response regulator [Kiritimatiellia bacterium]